MESEDLYSEDDYINENMEYETISEDDNEEMFEDDKKILKKRYEDRGKCLKFFQNNSKSATR